MSESNVPPNEQGGYQSQPGPQPASAPLSPEQDTQWASFAHLGGILGFLPSLIIWLVFKDRGQFTNTEAKEALNFQITVTIGYVALWILTMIITIVTFGLGSFLSLLVWVLWIASAIFSILGFVRSKDGQHYRYPFAFRFIK